MKRAKFKRRDINIMTLTDNKLIPKKKKKLITIYREVKIT